MKIICTYLEKENLMDSLCNSVFCPFGRDCIGGYNCERCTEDNIEWEIVDEQA